MADEPKNEGEKEAEKGRTIRLPEPVWRDLEALAENTNISSTALAKAAIMALARLARQSDYSIKLPLSFASETQALSLAETEAIYGATPKSTVPRSRRKE